MKKAREHIKKNRVLFFSYLCIVCIVGIAVLIMYRTEIHDARQQPRSVMTVKAGMTGSQEVLMLTGNARVSQEISMVSTAFTGFSLWFEDVRLSADGVVSVQLQDVSGEQVEAWEMDAAELSGGNYSRFYVPMMTVVPGEVYTIVIETHLQNEIPVLLSMVNLKDMRGVNALLHKTETGTAEIAGGEQEGDIYSLSYEIYDGDCGALDYFYLAVVSGIFLLLAVAYGMLVFQKKKEWIFAVMVCLLGGIYLLVIPPYAVPDESAHFISAYAQSSALLGKTVENEEDCVVLEPEAAGFLARKERPDRSSYASSIRGIFNKEENIISENVPGRKALDSPHLGYVPQVAGLVLGRLLHVNGTQMFLLGRIAALLWYCFLMFQAIRIIPDFGKNILFLAGIMPMTIQQVVSYNYDSVLIGASFFLVAYMLYLAFDEKKQKICWKDGMLVLVLAAVIVPIKFVYLPLLGLGLFIPAERFESEENTVFSASLFRTSFHISLRTGGRIKKILFGGMAVLSGMLILIATRMGSVIQTAATSTATGGAAETYTLIECLRDPIHIGILYFKTLEQSLSYYVESMIGTPLGWLEIGIPAIVVYGFAVLLLLSLLQQEGGHQWKAAERIWLLLLFGGMAFLICLALLLDWTSKESAVIQGVQGRYFIPLLPLLLLALQNKTVILKRRTDAFLISAAAGFHAATILSVISVVITR